MEILAPIGGREQLIAAVRSGADAVYLGAKKFNARQNAENFDAPGLSETVKYCHSHGVKVHVTLNTLVTDDELESLYETADEIAASGADAVILQDFAAIEYLKRTYPTLPRHASTQMAVHNAAGAKMMKKLGFSRVVLARELSLEEIRKIHEAADIELEAFVHGALCMCLSGACYMSSVLGGRSGNRGLCAQPCRLDFKANGRDHALSLKDMSHIKYISDMAQAGVSSFKIEGRMKRPEYVAAATQACRNAAEGKPYDSDTLRAVFSRAGFTDGYITANRTLDMFGYRGRDDVVAASGVLKQIENTYHKETARLKVDFELEIGRDKCILTAVCGDASAAVEGGGAIPARERETDGELAARSLKKLGGTQFYLGSVKVHGEGGLMAPPSLLNEMRRKCIAALSEKLGAGNVYVRENAPKTQHKPHKSEKTELWARFFTAEQLSNAEKYARIIMPISEIEKNPDLIKKLGHKLMCELPCAAFPEYEDNIEESLRKLKKMGLRAVYAENIYAVKMAQDMDMEICGGAGLNILNSDALDFYERLGLSKTAVSFELGANKIARLGGDIPRGAVVYGYLPLMRVRNCPMKTEKGCIGCDGRRKLTDRKNIDFTVLCEGKRYGTVLNSVPLHIAERRIKNIDFEILYFTVETKERCESVYKDYVNHTAAKYDRTGGLYYRNLL